MSALGQESRATHTPAASISSSDARRFAHSDATPRTALRGGAFDGRELTELVKFGGVEHDVTLEVTERVFKDRRDRQIEIPARWTMCWPSPEPTDTLIDT